MFTYLWKSQLAQHKSELKALYFQAVLILNKKIVQKFFYTSRHSKSTKFAYYFFRKNCVILCDCHIDHNL